tara:strand:- start:6213 stop:6881 length:669 start_codon:yes stop_codon:yes gene_type:complete
MDDESINKFNLIQDNLKKAISSPNKIPNIICVSKTFPIEKLLPLIKSGHCHFGENKVQEAIHKWKDFKINKPNIKLHMIGSLQRNKVKKAIELFDYIHSLDNQKLADTLKKNEINLKKKLKYFIQVNLGNEAQKSGILYDETKDFVKYCIDEARLDVIGLMIIPPNDTDNIKYFEKIDQLNRDLGFKDLSMGMSGDYMEATKYNSTYLRIGSAILGERKSSY